MFWLPIPLMWVAFALSPTLVGGAQALPVVCGLTVALSVLSRPFRRSRLRRHLPLAFPRLSMAAPAQAAEQAADPVAAKDEVTLPAMSALRALERAIEQQADLPEAAKQDLRFTAKELGRRLDQLAAEHAQLDAVLATPPDDLAWAERKLEKLDTLKRAGQPAPAHERERLMAAVAAHVQDQDHLAEAESKRTILRAAVLEIAATARRARQSLLSDSSDHTARLLAKKLAAQASAADRARRELAGR